MYTAVTTSHCSDPAQGYGSYTTAGLRQVYHGWEVIHLEGILGAHVHIVYKPLILAIAYHT